ncbi:hypothetical protein CLV40_1254 [Actinokineospora auranticolor]|uniref:DUF6531 domain-containing protein n=1 Tax=Actinokineospora auranticolor TaxID=155976 RepID=A0A2S6GEL2_9PSEU|nr:hypothetical protein CLV40_1254 [Actinokineospora auranticolor]
MSNPLVAAVKDSTTGYSGIPIAEDAVSAYQGISSGDWVEGGMGAVAFGMDVADTVANPFGALFAAGAGWLMEHFEPLRQALDWLAGKPDVIASYGQTWDNVSRELASIQQDHADLVSRDLTGWQGAAADAYRAHAAEVSDALASASSVAGGLSTGTTIMGALVAAVRSAVRDLIARLVGNAVQWLLEEAFTLGLATPIVVGQITVAVSNAMTKVSKLIAKVTGTIRKVTPLLEKLRTLFGKIADKLKNLRRTGRNHSPTAHRTAATKGDVPSARGANPHLDDPRVASRSSDRPFCKDDPIDVATGEVVLTHTDLSLPGVLPLVLERHHQSNYRSGELFGPSWSSTLDQRVEVTADAVWLFTEDGRRLRYPRVADEVAELPEHGPRIRLIRTDSGYRAVDLHTARTSVFVRVGAEWEAGSRLPLTQLHHRAGASISIDLPDRPVRAVRMRRQPGLHLKAGRTRRRVRPRRHSTRHRTGRHLDRRQRPHQARRTGIPALGRPRLTRQLPAVRNRERLPCHRRTHRRPTRQGPPLPRGPAQGRSLGERCRLRLGRHTEPRPPPVRSNRRETPLLLPRRHLMTTPEQTRGERLAAAGLILLGVVEPAEFTPRAAWDSVARGDEPTVAVDEEEDLSAVTAAWLTLARAKGLFAPDGSFLLSTTGDENPLPWAHVRPGPGPLRLAETLVAHPGEPEFVTMSLTGGHVCGVTTEEWAYWLLWRDLTP